MTRTYANRPSKRPAHPMPRWRKAGRLEPTVALTLSLWAAAGYAESAPVPAARCIQPPGNGSKIVPTRDFGDIKPTHATHTLADPLNPGSTAPITMLAFGDSAMWGNGLKNPHKYSYGVAQDVANGTGRTVRLVTYAHSGANIANLVDGGYEPLVPSDHGTPPGDLNAGLPTTVQQEACAAADERYRNAELILLDGCINDVGAQKIALPYPFGGATPDEIRKRAYEWCSAPMAALLRDTIQDFPRATIVVSNYWLIISDKSSPIGIAMQKRAAGSTLQERVIQKEMRELLDAELKVEQMTGQRVTGAEASRDPRATYARWGDSSRAFLDVSQGCFQWAVSSVDGVAVPPLGGSDKGCPSVAPIPPQPVSADRRVFLATVSDDPDYSYGAGPKKRLWSVPIPIVRQDELYVTRLTLCPAHYGPRDGNLYICQINPTAHPNRPGAQAFRVSIDEVLSVAWRIH